MPLPFLTGETLYLRPLLESDAKGPYVDWLNDPEVCEGNSHHVFPYTERKARSYIDHAGTADDALVLAVVLKDDHVHIGNVALQQINWVYRTAEFAILLGDKRHWGRGFGKEAARLIVAHGFRTLNLHRIDCATFDHNEGMRKLAASLGMKQEGVRRRAAFRSDRYVDIVEFGLLKEEFR